MKNKFEFYIVTFITCFFVFSSSVFAMTCDDLGDITETTTKIWYILLIAGPLILIVMSLLDVAKTLMSGEDGAFKKCFSRIVKRVVATIILILLPVLINFILGQIISMNLSICGVN